MWVQETKDLGHPHLLSQGAGTEAEQLEQELVPVRDAGVTGGSLT